jgi:hypothetical protein
MKYASCNIENKYSLELINKIANLYISGLSLKEVSIKTNISKRQVGKIVILKNAQRNKSDALKVGWKRKRLKKVKYIRKDGGRRKLRNVLGTTFIKGDVVHHIDGNHYNNKINNLMIMSNSEHSILEAKTRIIKKFGKHIKNIVREYEDGDSLHRLGDRYNTSKITIKRILINNNIYIRNFSESQKNSWKNGSR